MTPPADGDDDPIQKFDPKLLADGVEDGAYQQGTEQALRHGAQCVDSVSLKAEDNVFLFEERFDFAHVISISFILVTYHDKKETPEFSIRS